MLNRSLPASMDSRAGRAFRNTSKGWRTRIPKSPGSNRRRTRSSLAIRPHSNGSGEAAEFLARRGARLDLEGAAGVGRLDVVKTFFDEAGRLKSRATRKQMTSGFAWACQFGRTSVVDFLLRSGIAVDTKLRHN